MPVQDVCTTDRADVVDTTATACGATFNEWLRAWRQAAHLSQRDFAQLASLSARTIRGLEAGRCRPSQRSVRLIAAAAGLGLRNFCEIAGLPPPDSWKSERLTPEALVRAGVDQRRSLC